MSSRPAARTQSPWSVQLALLAGPGVVGAPAEGHAFQRHEQHSLEVLRLILQMVVVEAAIGEAEHEVDNLAEGPGP